MSLLAAGLIALIVIFIAWLLCQLPMAAPYVNLIRGVALFVIVLCILLWALRVLGVVTGMNLHLTD